MSYDLRIWEHPARFLIPTTLQQAAATFDVLVGTKAPINPKFVELARRLVAEYPSLEDDSDDGVWVGDPVHETHTCDEAVYALSLPPANRLALLRLVVDTATALGLTVLDEQIGMAFLPSGEVLPKENAAIWAQWKKGLDAAPRVTKAEMRKVLSTFLSEGLAKHGFKILKSPKSQLRFARQVEAGEQTIGFVLEGSSPDYECWLYCHGKCPEVSELVEPILGEAIPKIYHFVLTNFTNQSRLPVTTETDRMSFMNFIETKVVPVLDLIRDLKGLDHLFNGDFPAIKLKRELYNSGPEAPMISLTLAYLLNNPRFQVLLDEYSELVARGVTEEIRTKPARMAQHLREHAKSID